MSPLPKDPTPVVPIRYQKPPSAIAGSPGMSRARLRGWAVTDVPQYPGYKTPTKIEPRKGLQIHALSLGC
jgi:hypothetical protein